MTSRTYSAATQCDGKLRYDTKADAKRAAKRSEQHGCGRLHVYRCGHCGRFHLGHKPTQAYQWP